MNIDLIARNYRRVHKEQSLQLAEAAQIQAEIIAKAPKNAQPQSHPPQGGLWLAIRSMLRLSFRGDRIDGSTEAWAD